MLAWLSTFAGSGANAADAAAPLETVDQPVVQATLQGANPQWNLRLAEGTRRFSISAKDVVLWGVFPDDAKGKLVLLSGGGRLAAKSVTLRSEHLDIDCEPLGPVSLPLENVAAIVLSSHGDRAERDQLIDSLLASEGERDRLILENGDQLRGTLTALGTESIAIDTDNGKSTIDLVRVTAVVFDPALQVRPPQTGVRAWIGLQGGSRVLATTLVADKDKANLNLAGNVALGAPTATIAAIQPLGGRAVYVSDLEPSGYRHIPYLSVAWPYRVDRSVLGTELRAGGALFLKGLGMHSASRISYRLEKRYRRLEGKLAIDDQAGRGGSVTFRVFVDDGSGGWRTAFTSDVLRGGDPPRSMRVDVSGAKRISLMVDFADRADQLDYADWLNLRLVE